MTTEREEEWLDVGVDLASRIWVNWQLLSREELCALALEQWTNPIPGRNDLVRPIEGKNPALRRKARQQP